MHPIRFFRNLISEFHAATSDLQRAVRELNAYTTFAAEAARLTASLTENSRRLDAVAHETQATRHMLAEEIRKLRVK